MPTLPEDARTTLCSPISEQEVREAIGNLQGGKAPGPDGFSSEFYKQFTDYIVGPLTNMFSESFTSGCLPPTLNMAHICLILKKNKPPESCSSYRLISLLGVDCKILAKILATRLERFLPNLINHDQTGFIINRHSHTNMRRFLNVIQYSQTTRTNILAISLDAEKAFERVEWEYLFDVMKRFKLGDTFYIKHQWPWYL